MPKINFMKRSKHIKRDFQRVENCGALENKIHQIWPFYKKKLTLEESKTILMIARTILANNSHLSQETRCSFHDKLNKILLDCKAR